MAFLKGPMEGFKKFILRGNVIELAVAVIIGGAFKTIVDKLVEGVINPLLGAAFGKPNFDEALVFGPVKLGLVLTAIVNFVLMAAVIYFLLVNPTTKLMARMKKQEPEAVPPKPSEEVEILRQIRDALQSKKLE